MNYAENIIAPGLAMKPDGIAVTAVSEGDGKPIELTFRDLEREVARWAEALRSLGIGIGDRVAVILPNNEDCLALLLAASSIGAIYSSTSPDMGVKGIVERYVQILPKVIVCQTHVIYAGKKIDLRDTFSDAIRQLEARVKELSMTIVTHGPVFAGRNVKQAKDILPSRFPPLKYEQLPFDHPIYVLYSSGTTGPPKCICHAAGRVLLQQKKELYVQLDVGRNSTHYQYTTTGWMMWNYMIAVLSVGARLVLYDGSPLHPTPLSQLDIVEKYKVTSWGTSPKYLAALRQHGIPKGFLPSSLRHVHSAGAPLSGELFDWFYSHFPQDVSLINGSGGTDLVGGIVGGTSMHPIYSGEICGPSLGMKVEIWNEDGQNIESTGAKGDLVITKPFFSMPITFWGADGMEKYRKAYFDKFPGVWCHGDFIRRNTSTGGYEILGRSDGVLNPGGVRFGTAELYAVLDSFCEVQDCIGVGQKLLHSKDEQVLLFVKLQSPTSPLDKILRSRIRTAIRTALSARHVPAHILQVADIPYTINGKKMENLVRSIVEGKDVGARRMISNPECLKEYERFVALSSGREVKL